MDVSAVLLAKLLTKTEDKKPLLEAYSKLKLVFLDPAYSRVYLVINNYYERYNCIPTFDELKVCTRDGSILTMLHALEDMALPDVPVEVILDSLIDQYTQNEAIKLLDGFIDKLPLYDSTEVKENLSEIALAIEDMSYTSENVYDMRSLNIFQHDEDIARDRIYLGLNNDFDAAIGGLARQELMLVGGKRGAGKSIVCSNLFTEQYVRGNTSLYFSIEMTALEVYQRNMSILTGIDMNKIKLNKLNEEETLKVIEARAGMFKDAEELVEKYKEDKNKFEFEDQLIRNCPLKDNQMIIIDNSSLALSSIDLQVAKAKARFGDSLGIVIVDYINKIIIEGASQFDWQPQVEMADKLKKLARKHDVAIVSPYQIDATGEARFAKGILDAADIALILEAKEDSISFKSTKMRGAGSIEFTCPVNFSNVTISPTSINPQQSQQKKLSKKEEKAHDVWS